MSAWQTTSPSEWPSGPRVERHDDAGEHERTAVDEPVQVVAGADARRADAQPRARGRRSSGVVIFTLRSSPCDDAHRHVPRARPASPRRSRPAPRASASAASSTSRRNPCGVCASQISSRGIVSCTTAADDRTRLTVSRAGTAGTAAPRLARAGDHAIDERRVGERPRRVVDQDDIDVTRRARDTAAHRILAPLAAGDETQRRPRSPPTSDGPSDTRFRREHDDRLTNVGMRGERRDAALQKVRPPPRSRNCLGTAAPSRAPRPAATITTPTDTGLILPAASGRATAGRARGRRLLRARRTAPALAACRAQPHGRRDPRAAAVIGSSSPPNSIGRHVCNHDRRADGCGRPRPPRDPPGRSDQPDQPVPGNGYLHLGRARRGRRRSLKHANHALPIAIDAHEALLAAPRAADRRGCRTRRRARRSAFALPQHLLHVAQVHRPAARTWPWPSMRRNSRRPSAWCARQCRRGRGAMPDA